MLKYFTDADEHLQISKKSRADESLKINEIKDVQMQPSASRDHIGFFDNLKSYGHHSKFYIFSLGKSSVSQHGAHAPEGGN